MADKKKTGLGRRLGYIAIALIVLQLLTGADVLGGLGLLLLIIGVIVSFAEGRRSTEA